jgi:hypothetical protein
MIKMQMIDNNVANASQTPLVFIAKTSPSGGAGVGSDVAPETFERFFIPRLSRLISIPPNLERESRCLGSGQIDFSPPLKRIPISSSRKNTVVAFRAVNIYVFGAFP